MTAKAEANPMTKHRSELLHQARQLAQSLQQEPADAGSVLGGLTESAVESIPGAQYAGITISSDRGDVRSVAATGRYPMLLDEIQHRYREGPCLSAAWEQHTIRITDLALEQRWPSYCRDAAAQTPIRSIMSFQLFADHRTTGALNVYAEQPDAFDDDAVELGLIAATHTSLAWNLLRRDEQFRSALASRDIIGQAKGMLMERFKIDAVQAFELLKRLSQTSNTVLAALARQLVEAERTGR
jgi:GAF domain-containing protein